MQQIPEPLFVVEFSQRAYDEWMKHRLTIVVAAANNDVIGRNNQLPWRLPADLKQFKALTLGKPVIMGRKTFESIGRPLPGRDNIVVSRQVGLLIPGCKVARSLEMAIELAGDAPEVMLIGGGELYREALDLADRIHLTRVHAEPDGDAHFPRIDREQWQATVSDARSSDEQHEHAFTFEVWDRVEPG